MSSVADVFLGISPKYSEQLFLKETFQWMFQYLSASDEVTLQKKFGGSKPSSKLILKTKWYHSFGGCDDSQNCEQLKKLFTDDCNWTQTHNHLVHERTLNHLDFEPQSPSVTGNVCCYYNN